MKNKVKPFLILIGLLLAVYVGEYLIDNFFGDGDGKITNPLLLVIFIILKILLIVTFLLGVIKSISERWSLRVPQKYRFVIHLSVILSLLVGAEIYVRSTYERINLYNLTGKTLIENPMKNWAYGDAFSAYKPIPDSIYENKRVNKLGFISPEIEIEKPDSVIRIVFLGGSSTAGQGLMKIEETWPQQSLDTLREKFGYHNIEIVNAAVGGYSTFESYGRLWSRIRFLDPDIVIVNHGWNEMYYYRVADKIFQWRGGLTDWKVNSLVKLEIYKPLVVDNFIRWSQLLSHVRIRLSHTGDEGEVANRNVIDRNSLDTTYNSRGLEIFENNMQLIKTFADNNDIELLVCKQPTLISQSLPDSLRHLCRDYVHGFNYDAHIKAFDDIYTTIDHNFKTEDIIDLSSMNGNIEYFKDHIHPTSEGCSEYASIVSKEIDKKIRK